MFPGSNSVLTGQLMLEHKGIDYTTVRLPAAHAFILLALGFPTMGVPALTIDGRRVQGTRSISRALDELIPARPLFPAGRSSLTMTPLVEGDEHNEDLARRRLDEDLASFAPSANSAPDFSS